jgi:hypothetical protein
LDTDFSVGTPSDAASVQLDLPIAHKELNAFRQRAWVYEAVQAGAAIRDIDEPAFKRRPALKPDNTKRA